jgi:two-component system chemotaxis sensor kinase CheA
MVRDLSRDLNKRVHLNILGAMVEIDKTVLDSLNDPLLHLLRNAIDHGLETEVERTAAGKSPVGNITITVEQRGNEIKISVADDGRGIQVEKVRQKAIQNQIVTQAEAESMTEDELRQLIFHSGFSTSNIVTPVSGRGLGMDIVRTRVESLRGQISVQSEPGEGTMITIRVPVSLTRIRCILLRIGEENYAIPSAMVLRMKSVRRDEVFTAEGKDMVMVNKRPMPLISLGALLDVVGAAPDADEEDILHFIALHAVDRSVAFEVDALYSEIELVLKPLGPELAGVPCVSGAALLGTGEVIIVLDANDLIRKATGTVLPRRRLSDVRPVPQAASPQQRLRILVVDDSITTRTLEKNILETAGFDVHVAIDGVEAWSMLNDMVFDLVISDVEMPNMNGLELTQRIKGYSQTANTPVILLTSLAKPEQREAGLRSGADAYLVKSQFDQGQLLEVIQSVI